MRNKRMWLNEVSFMRPILLILLVSYHAFAPYVGSWPLPDGIHDVEAYKWISLLSRAFRLEGFVFISGYIFTFQIIERGKFPTFGSLLSSKVQRLLVPSVLFSLLYFLCFKDLKNIFSFCKEIVGGVGHLWYLPCLFVCFLAHYLLLKSKLSPKEIILILIIMAAFSFIPLPLHLNKPLYYMLFFYGGGLFWQNSQKIHEKASISGTVIMWILFLVCFVVFNLAMEFFSEIRESTDSRMIRVALYSANNLLKATLGWIGITACYLSAVRYCMEHNLSETIIKIGACGYGVYVFHQFILVFLYRYTSLPQMTGSYLMPWVGFIITVVLSTTMAILIRMTSFGRKYL